MRLKRLLEGLRDRSRRPARSSRPGCRFCDSLRSWMAGHWRRLVQALRAAAGGARRLLERARPWRRGAEAPARPEIPVQRFRRQAYPGSRNRRFELYLPRGYNDNSVYPLVMILHGCRQDSADIRHISNFDAIADRERFIVVYPFVTGYSGMRIRNCWGWWLDQEIRPGAGEVEDLWQIVEQIGREVRIDERRVHVAGLSSGGGMAVAAMVVHADKFASGATVAGLPYSETTRAVAYGAPGATAFKATERVVSSMRSVMGKHGRPSPIFIVHSSDDPVVDIQAARNIRDSWACCYELDPMRSESQSSGITGGVDWTHCRYRPPRRRSVIETFFIAGRGHGWYGGNPGKFSYPDAPDTSELMWRFFKRHPLQSKLDVRDTRQPMPKVG